MLVLSSKKNEVIRIRDDVRITVVEIRGDKVRIGIDAPKDISVHREEIYQLMQKERNGGSSNTLREAFEKHQDDINKTN